MKRAIVLSGGGSKGAYQIGVWKALRKLRIRYNIVTGTSVGALNAALMTQNIYYKAMKFWKNISFNNVLDEKIETTKKSKIYKTYLKGAFKGGMTINNLEKTVDRAINVKKIYSSKIDIGIIVFKLKNLKYSSLTKKDMPKEKFKDYIVASASCFPAFAKKKIDNENYIDGGIYDNLPINLAIDMDATEIIAVDLDEVGIKRKTKNKNISIKYIKPKNDIGSFLIFNKDAARRAIKFGYNDTLKIYNKLEGNKYTFKNLNKNYNKYYAYLKNELEIRKIDCCEKLLNEKTSYNEFNVIIEQLGEVFNIDYSKIYKIKKFNKMLKKEFQNTKEFNIIKNIKENKKLFFNKEAVKFVYNKIDNKRLIKYFGLIKNQYLCALYLKVIIENR